MTDNPNSNMNMVININIDKQALNQTIGGLNNVQKEFKNTVNSMVSEGRKLSAIGAELNRISSSILGPLTQAADEYAKRYKGLEAPANAFLAAQEKQKNAMTDLGRVASTALIPRLNELADITERIAQFAGAHPDLVNTAVQVASVTAMAGGVLVATGQIGATLGRIQQIVQSGGLVGNLSTAIISIGALAAGAKLAEFGLNKIGEATGNTYLEQYKLSDALKTGRESLVGTILVLSQSFIDAKKTVSEMGLIIEGASTLIGTKFDEITDRLATSLRELPDRLTILLNKIHDGFADLINGLIKSINDKFGTTIGLVNHVTYANALTELTPEQKIANQEASFSQRQTLRNANSQAMGNDLQKSFNDIQAQYKTDQQTLSKLADSLTNFAKTGTLGDVADNLIAGIKAKFSNITGGTSSTNNVAGSQGFSPEATNAYIDMQKQISASNIKYENEKRDIVTRSNDAILKAQQDHGTALLKLHEEEQTAESDLLTRQKDIREKSQRDFLFNEQEIAKKQQFDRLQKERETNLKLSELAANNDVAGFIQAQNQANLANQQQTDQDNFDKQDRLDKFKNNQNEQALSDKEALDQLRVQNKQKETALDQSYKQQLADLNKAKDDQLGVLKQHHTDELTEYQRHFAETLAGLQDNVGGLKAIHDQFYSDMTTAAENYVNRNSATLQKLYNQTLPQATTPTPPQPTVPTANVAQQPIVLTSPNQVIRSGQIGIPEYDTGSPYVPYDMFAKIHQGEIIIPASTANGIRSGNVPSFGSGNGSMRGGNRHTTVSPIINIGSVGEHVSKSDLEMIKEAAIVGSLQAFSEVRMQADAVTG